MMKLKQGCGGRPNTTVGCTAGLMRFNQLRRTRFFEIATGIGSSYAVFLAPSGETAPQRSIRSLPCLSTFAAILVDRSAVSTGR